MSLNEIVSIFIGIGVCIMMFAFAIYIIDEVNNPPEDICKNDCNMLELGFFDYQHGGIFSNEECWCIDEDIKETKRIR